MTLFRLMVKMIEVGAVNKAILIIHVKGVEKDTDLILK